MCVCVCVCVRVCVCMCLYGCWPPSVSSSHRASLGGLECFVAVKTVGPSFCPFTAVVVGLELFTDDYYCYYLCYCFICYYYDYY